MELFQPLFQGVITFVAFLYSAVIALFALSHILNRFNTGQNDSPENELVGQLRQVANESVYWWSFLFVLLLLMYTVFSSL